MGIYFTLSFCSMGRYFIKLFRDFFAAVAKLSDLTFTPLKLWKLSAQWADTVLCYFSAQWAGTLFCYLSAQWADTLLRILPFTAFVTHVKNHLFKEILNISNSISLNSSSLVLETNIIWDQYYITLETWFLDYSTASFYIHYSSSYLKKPKTETSCWSMASWTELNWTELKICWMLPLKCWLINQHRSGLNVGKFDRVHTEILQTPAVYRFVMNG